MERKLVVFVIAVAVILASCSGKPLMVKSPVKNLHAPGQMKKLTGSKSAAPYAPGQQKKAAANTSGNSSANKAGKKK